MLLLLISTAVNTGIGQKIIQKSLVVKNARFFYINSDYAYRVELETNKTEEISVEATIDGEYKEDILLLIEEKDANVEIRSDFRPDSQEFKDKLSAHKVLSISMKISLPEDRSVWFKGNNTHLKAGGNYDHFQVLLLEGRCELNDLSGRVRVNTSSGDIFLRSKGGVVHAVSDYGQIQQEELPLGNADYQLKTITGDIHIDLIN